MNQFTYALQSIRATRAAAAMWGLLLAVVVTALISGPMPSANATTTGTGSGSVRVIANTSGQLPLLTATRVVGSQIKYTFNTAALHVNPLPSSGEAQFVQVEWYLQRASNITGPDMRWNAVDSKFPSAGLYTVIQDREDPEGLGYMRVPLTGGVDMASQPFAPRVILAGLGGPQAYRVVATVTWSDRDTGQVLGTATLSSSTTGDLACASTLATRSALRGGRGSTPRARSSPWCES